MIGENVRKIKERIRAACLKSGRDAASVGLIAVTKTRNIGQIEEVLAAGICFLGENKVQEALLKFENPSGSSDIQRIQWHMIGHLQTNKVKEAVRIFSLIHSVDSLRLAQEIDKQAARINKVQEVLLEIKTSAEATKFGIAPEQVFKIFGEIVKLKNLRVRGLMTMAPLGGSSESSRPFFSRLRLLRNELEDQGFVSGGLSILSMGMSDDFEVAVEEGSTMVRIGRAIFEA